MRASLQLLAHVKPGTFLEANAPTGLTGLFTHPSPRPALILTYRKTLEQLKQIPTTSVYRQSAEALTKHRLSIVESTKPAGHAEWLSRIQKTYDSNPGAFKGLERPDSGFAHVKTEKSTNPNWDGKLTRADALPEGANTEAMANAKAKAIQEEVDESERPPVSTFDDLEVEPPLFSEQYVNQNSASQTRADYGLGSMR